MPSCESRAIALDVKGRTELNDEVVCHCADGRKESAPGNLWVAESERGADNSIHFNRTYYRILRVQCIEMARSDENYSSRQCRAVGLATAAGGWCEVSGGLVATLHV